jgi:sporulation protein YlmC with PRC-barrel domain
MMKKLMLGAAVSALIVSGALAATPEPNAKSTPPAAAQKSTPPAAAQNDKAAGKADFVMTQKPDQFLASKFKGTDVIGTDNKKIGDVADILFDKDGKIEAYVIQVGGFLGMGGKEVALAPSSFEVVPGKNPGDEKLRLSMNKQQLKEAQNFTPYSPPRPVTTGAGGGLSRSPLGGAHPPGGGMK